MLVLLLLSQCILSSRQDITWPPLETDCARVCCHNSAHSRPVPVSPSCPEGPEWPDKVFCYSGLCLLKNLAYDQYKVPPETALFDHIKDHMKQYHTDDPCPASDPNEADDTTEPITPLVVDTFLKVNSISGINLEEQSCVVSLTVHLSWYDSNLFTCSCNSEKDYKADIGDMVVLGNHVEDDIWVPDLSIWEYRRFFRDKGLSDKKLNKITVENVVRNISRNSTSPRVHFEFDLEATLTCHYSSRFFPYDRNVCKVQFGSYTFDERVLAFRLAKEVETVDLDFQEYKITLLSLTGSDARILYQGLSYQYTGFKFLVSRLPYRLRYQYTLAISVMVVWAIASSLISVLNEEAEITDDRTGLLSGSLISALLIFQHAARHTPESEEVTFTPVLTVILVGLGFITLAILEYCVVLSPRLFPSLWKKIHKHERVRICSTLDICFFLVGFVLYIAFIIIFWASVAWYADSEGCHNSHDDD